MISRVWTGHSSKSKFLTVLLILMLGVLWASPAYADDDDDGGSDDDDFVSNQVVVKLKPWAKGDVRPILREYRAKVKDRFGRDVFLLTLPRQDDEEREAEDIENERRVAYAEPNFTTETPGGNPRRTAFAKQRYEGRFSTDYAHRSVNLACAREVNSGRGSVVAVLDTGVQISHPALRNKLTNVRYDYVNGGQPGDTANGRDDDRDGLKDEAVGHGTHVAGIVAQVAPEARIMPIRVLDSDGRGNAFVLAEAIDYASRRGADVINLSLGAARGSELVEQEISEAINQRGVVVVAAAGNEGARAKRYPAAGWEDADVLSVTAIDRKDRRPWWANYGWSVDVAAPGYRVYSAFPTSTNAWWDGTSMATPFVAGQAALIKSEWPSLEPAAINDHIKSTGTSIRAANTGKPGLPHNKIDVGASVGCDGTPPPANNTGGTTGGSTGGDDDDD